MGRTAVADFFGTKKRVPAFDFGGVDVIVDGRFNGTDRRYVLNATKPVLNAAGTELSFSPVYALNTSSEGQVDGLVDAVLKRTANAKMMNTSSASKLEDVVVVVDAYAPQAAAAMKRAKAKASAVAAAAPPWPPLCRLSHAQAAPHQPPPPPPTAAPSAAAHTSQPTRQPTPAGARTWRGRGRGRRARARSPR